MARILLIDDDQPILDLEKVILYGEGHEVLEAKDALSALDLLHLYDVDLIVVDINMPRLNGFQFITSIRPISRLKNIPIVFLTASLKKDDVAMAAKIGADSYLLKPLVPEVYLKRIADIFAKHPPKQSLKAEFPDLCSAEIKIHRTVLVCSVSEVGVEIIIDQDLEEGQVIELPSYVLQDSLREDPFLKVLSVKQYNEKCKKVFLGFLRPNVEIVQKLKHFVSSKNKSSDISKYPSWR